MQKIIIRYKEYSAMCQKRNLLPYKNKGNYVFTHTSLLYLCVIFLKKYNFFHRIKYFGILAPQ